MLSAHAHRFVDAIEGCDPVVIGIQRARDVFPDLESAISHAGPPFKTTDELPGVVFGAAVGALRFEGLAEADAIQIVSDRQLPLVPNQDLGMAAPLAGVVSGSMPVFVVEDQATGTTVAAPLNEGLGKVLRFGAHDDDVITRLHTLADRTAAAMDAAIRSRHGIHLRTIMERALRQGDELHNRNAAATAIFARDLAPDLVRENDRGLAADALDYLRSTDHFFLNLSLASAKCMLDAAAPAAPPGVVLAMGANGREFGLKVSGAAGWFTATAPLPMGRIDSGFTKADASLLTGDSCLIEAIGLGGLAIDAAPDVWGYLGVSGQEAARIAAEGRLSCVVAHRALRLPDGRGLPFGIDVQLALDAPSAPCIDAGIAHAAAGLGQIGAGVAPVPTGALQSAATAVRQLN